MTGVMFNGQELSCMICGFPVGKSLNCDRCFPRPLKEVLEGELEENFTKVLRGVKKCYPKEGVVEYIIKFFAQKGKAINIKFGSSYYTNLTTDLFIAWIEDGIVETHSILVDA